MTAHHQVQLLCNRPLLLSSIFMVRVCVHAHRVHLIFSPDVWCWSAAAGRFLLFFAVREEPKGAFHDDLFDISQQRRGGRVSGKVVYEDYQGGQDDE